MTQENKQLVMILACNLNYTIGHAGGIPWKVKGDLERFKRLTMGNTVVMGRKTYESLGKPLAGRYNIVVSSTMEETPGVVVVRSPLEAIEEYGERGTGDMFIIGGANLYWEFLPYASRIYLTKVENDFDGDTKFRPVIDDKEFVMSSMLRVTLESGEISHTYMTIDRL